jgi:hypothetical protein
MMPDMDSMEASCVFYVTVDMSNHLEQSPIWLVTVNTVGIVRLTVQHDFIVSVSFMYHPGDFVRQISAGILFLKKVSNLYLTIMRFRLSYTTTDPWTQTNYMGPTYWELQNGWKPLQLAAIRSSIQLEYNIQLGFYLSHSAMKLTMYSSGLLTLFCNHLPLLFHTPKSYRNKHLGLGTPDQN